MVPWTFVYKIFVDIFSVLLGTYLEMELYDNFMFNPLRNF